LFYLEPSIETIVQLAVLQNSSAAGATQTNFVKLPKRCATPYLNGRFQNKLN